MRTSLEETVIGAYFKLLKDIEDGIASAPGADKFEASEIFAD